MVQYLGITQPIGGQAFARLYVYNLHNNIKLIRDRA